MSTVLCRPTYFLKKDRRRSHRIGDRRLRLAEPVLPYKGLYYVQAYGDACPQQALKLPNGLDLELVHNINELVATMYDKMRSTDEDCKETMSFFSFSTFSAS